jgi:hypothetical protein
MFRPLERQLEMREPFQFGIDGLYQPVQCAIVTTIYRCQEFGYIFLQIDVDMTCRPQPQAIDLKVSCGNGRGKRLAREVHGFAPGSMQSGIASVRLLP